MRTVCEKYGMSERSRERRIEDVQKRPVRILCSGEPSPREPDDLSTDGTDANKYK